MRCVLQVKIANQESELVNLLKRIPLGDAELSVIREKAEKIRDGLLISRDQAHLPLMLTTLIFECLCLPGKMSQHLLSIDSSLLLFRLLLYLI